jgi:hypothetical protein
MMTRKFWMLISFAVLLGAASFYFNRDWFGRQDIQIFHRNWRQPRPKASTAADIGPIEPLKFGLTRPVKMKSLEVVAVQDIATNRFPKILWHLVSDSNSIPTSEFVYGQWIRGMHPQFKGASATPLEPGVSYRLYVEVGSQKLEHDFTPDPVGH